MIFISKPCVNYCIPRDRMSNIKSGPHIHPQTVFGWMKKEGVLPWELGEEDAQRLIYEITSQLPQGELTITNLILLELCGFDAKSHFIQKNRVIKSPSDLEKRHPRTLLSKLTWTLGQAKTLPIGSINLLWTTGRKLRKFLWVFGMYDPFMIFNTLKFLA